VGEIDEAQARLDPEHDALADRDRVVSGPEVGEEDDGRRRADGTARDEEREQEQPFAARHGGPL
jgi:hypothetical protein